MAKFIYLFTSLILLSCHTTTYYIVRHAEKETTNTMTTDVPLSAAGKDQAVDLKEKLKGHDIRHIFSTNYSRTLATVEPTRQYFNTIIQLYNTKDTMDRFIEMLRKINEGNVLIVGHANTVDDIINKLTGEKILPGDLPDSAYGDLFIVKKRGEHYSYRKEHFGRKKSI